MELIDIIILFTITCGAAYYLWKKFFLAGGCGCGSGCSDCSDGCGSEKEKMEKVYGIKEREVLVARKESSVKRKTEV